MSRPIQEIEHDAATMNYYCREEFSKFTVGDKIHITDTKARRPKHKTRATIWDPDDDEKGNFEGEIVQVVPGRYFVADIGKYRLTVTLADYLTGRYKITKDGETMANLTKEEILQAIEKGNKSINALALWFDKPWLTMKDILRGYDIKLDNPYSKHKPEPEPPQETTSEPEPEPEPQAIAADQDDDIEWVISKAPLKDIPLIVISERGVSFNVWAVRMMDGVSFVRVGITKHGLMVLKPSENAIGCYKFNPIDTKYGNSKFGGGSLIRQLTEKGIKFGKYLMVHNSEKGRYELGEVLDAS